MPFGDVYPNGDRGQALRMTNPVHIRPVHKTRWGNFRRLLAENNLSVTAAAARLEKTQGQVSHFGGKTPSKIIGDDIAGEIEAAFSLPAGALDIPADTTEPFNNANSTLQGNPANGSRSARLDVSILAEAVEVITVDEATNGLYSFTKHAALLMELYDQLLSGKTKTELVAKLTKQRSQGEESNGAIVKGATVASR